MAGLMNEKTIADDAPFGAWTPFVTPFYPGDRVAVEEKGGDGR